MCVCVCVCVCLCVCVCVCGRKRDESTKYCQFIARPKTFTLVGVLAEIECLPFGTNAQSVAKVRSVITLLCL